MKSGINRVGDDLIFIMPRFIHEFGDDVHHWSMARTCEFDEDEGIIPFTGPSHRRYVIHEFLDLWIFYPIQHWMRKWLGENRVFNILRSILGFFWGINCGFPFRDVANYFIWNLRGNPPRAAFKKREGKWIQTYPNSLLKETEK